MIPPQGTPTEVYFLFAGAIDTEGVKRLFKAFALATKNGVKRVHLLIQSDGGTVTDGIALHNYLREVDFEVVTYNGGVVASIAVLVFLAGAIRKASHNASFLIHKSTFAPTVAATADAMEARVEAVRRNDALIEEILHSNLNMPSAKWEIHAVRDLVITAQEAVEFTLIHNIEDFKAPSGSECYTI